MHRFGPSGATKKTAGNTRLLASCCGNFQVAVTNQFGPGKMTPRFPYPCPIRGGQDMSSLEDLLEENLVI